MHFVSTAYTVVKYIHDLKINILDNNKTRIMCHKKEKNAELNLRMHNLMYEITAFVKSFYKG